MATISAVRLTVVKDVLHVSALAPDLARSQVSRARDSIRARGGASRCVRSVTPRVD